MDQSNEEACASCPYFLEDMQACRLHPYGIYLPHREHLLKYCLSSEYTNCLTYNRFYLLKGQKSDIQLHDEADRRHSRRIAEQRKVLIRTCDKLGIVIGDFAERALTVDYSQKGMRIVINREIPDDSLLLFDFDFDFLVPRLQGIAEPRWHKNLKSSQEGVEVGLQFTDSQSQTALAQELEQ